METNLALRSISLFADMFERRVFLILNTITFLLWGIWKEARISLHTYTNIQKKEERDADSPIQLQLLKSRPSAYILRSFFSHIGIFDYIESLTTLLTLPKCSNYTFFPPLKTPQCTLC